jgi:High potential iron-sulfur protein
MKQLTPTGVSRRSVLIAAAGAAPLLALGATGAQAAKLSQTAARYQPTPKDGKQCDGCKFFEAPSSCKSVDGTIAAAGWCALWVKKA